MKLCRHRAERYRLLDLRQRRDLTCDEAQEAISSQLDGEGAGMREADLETHLSTCRQCQRFKSLSAVLVPRVSLRLSRAAPDALYRVLATFDAHSSDRPAAGYEVHRRRGLWRPWDSGRSVAKWAGVIAPVAVAVAVVPLGTAIHPHLVPSHLPSPCTIWLRHFKLR